MLRTIVFLAALGLTLADFDCCSLEDRREIQHFWHGIWSPEFTGKRQQLASAVFEELFVQDPGSKSVFADVNVDDPDSAEFKAHAMRVVNGLDTVIGIFDDTRSLFLELEHLGRQHEARTGIRKEHFDTIAIAYGKVLPQISGCFNAQAWERCFDGIAHEIASYLSE